MYSYRGNVTKVIDGDTIDVDVDLGFHVTLNMRLRLYGINAPEMKGETIEAGKASRAWLDAKLAADNYEVDILTIKDKREKYGRYLAKVYTRQSARSVNELSVEHGMSVIYME